jgi:hypothetical protein
MLAVSPEIPGYKRSMARKCRGFSNWISLQNGRVATLDAPRHNR